MANTSRFFNGLKPLSFLDKGIILRTYRREIHLPYVEKKVIAGRTIEIEKYYTSIFHKKGIEREKKELPTREEQKKINSRQAEKKLRYLINTNFGEGDYHLILTYTKDSRPEAKEEARKNIQVFLRKMRKEYRDRGKEMKYIHVVEVGARGSYHHHLVINEIEVKAITKNWPHGRPKINPLDNTGQYKKLASYLIKYTDRLVGEDGKLQGKRWDPSRNLKKPIIKKRIVPVKSGFREDIREIGRAHV